MPYTMEDFDSWYTVERFARLTPEERKRALDKLTPEERRKTLEALPPEERLAGLTTQERLEGLSPQQIQEYLDKLAGGSSAKPRKPRRKK